MIFRKIHSYFPFTRLFKLLIFLSLGLQLIVISQMYFYKDDIFQEPMLVLIRLFRGTVLSYLAGIMLAYPYLILIRKLNSGFPWKRNAMKRFFIQFPIAILAGLFITPVILIPAGIFFGMDHEIQTIINNSFYLILLSLFLMAILEAIIHFNESDADKAKALNLEKELISEAAEKAMLEARAKMEEEKNRFSQQLLEREKLLNHNLELEIEKREQITEELKESREQLQSILSNLVGATYRCKFDEQYTVEYISEKIYDISGYHASEFIENNIRSYASIIHPDDLAICKKNISTASLSKTHYEFEYRIIHRNGNIVWVSENGKSIFDPGGNLSFLDGIIVDITRRKEAELAAKETERNFKELMDFLPQTIFELDLEGKILFSNKAADDFFGTIPKDPDNRASALDYFIKEDIPRIIENFQKSAQGIQTDPGEYTAVKKDGTLCPVMVFGTPIVRDGKIVGRRGFIIDISKRKQYEIDLLNAKEELEEINNTLEQTVAKRTRELTAANTQLLKVQKENLQSQFEVLKSQINPHFMFNSLNVLSGLINVDVAKAQLFIDEFSQIYRYVLETIEQRVVTLKKELEFMRSFLFLQQIRYGENLTYNVNIPAELLPMVVPPLSLQVLLENAMKHNIVNEEKPLNIEIYSEGDFLIVKNPIQPKISGKSTGLGLKNLVKRYALIGKMEPAFKIVNNYYVAKLPLIKIEQDERTDN